MKRSLFWCLACAMLFAGCSASQVHYHTLASSDAFEGTDRKSADFLLEVMPVSVPPSLDQAYLAIRRGQTEIEFVDDERWASPLDNEIRSALAVRLAARLNTDDVDAGSAPSDNAGRQVATLRVRIRQLDVWPGSRVQLTAGWRVGFRGRRDRVLSCVTHLEEKVEARDFGGLVQAQRAVIVQLADIVGANIAALEKSADTECLPAAGNALTAR